MGHDEKIGRILAQLEKLAQTAIRQQEEISALRGEMAELVSQSLRQGLPDSVFEDVAPENGSVPHPVTEDSIPEKAENPAPEPLVLMQMAAASTPPKNSASEAAARPQQKPPQNWEAFVGGNLINKIGIFILVAGLGIFVKYAIDNNMIGSVGRVALGYAAGLALLAVAYRLKAKYLSFSAVLLSGGVATLYFTTYFAYDFYALLPHALAFALMAGITAFTVYAATAYNQQVIGVMGLVGAYAVPMLLSQNSGKVAVLFTFIGIINIGVATLAYRKKWLWMNVTAFLMTWGVFLVWYVLSFQPDEHFAIAMGFGAAFFITFYAIFVFYQLPYDTVVRFNTVFLLLNTFFYFSVGYSAMTQAGYGGKTALFSLAIAAVHAVVAWLVWRRKLSEPVFYLAVALALTFVTMAVELHFGGLTVTLLWAVEAAALCWVGSRTKAGFYVYAALVLVALSTLSLIGVWQAAYADNNAVKIFANRYFLSGLGVLVTQLAIAWMVRKNTDVLAEPFRSWLMHGLLVLVLVLFYANVSLEISHHFDAQMFVQKDYLRTMVLEHQKQVWLLVFSSLFVAALAGLAVRYLKSQVWWAAVVGLGSIVVAWWFFVQLLDIEPLRDAYLAGNPPVSGGWMFMRYAVYGCVAACLFLMRKIAHNPLMDNKSLRNYLSVLIHFFVLGVLSFELRNLIMFASRQPEEASRVFLRAGLGVLWGSYALALVVAGIRLKQRLLRLLGIFLFAITLTKLFLIDIGQLSTLGKIIAFVALGILLLVISFLYQRFKDVILAEDGQGRG